jgi:hypothetical protein
VRSTPRSGGPTAQRKGVVGLCPPGGGGSTIIYVVSHRSRHCFPTRPGKCAEISDHFEAPFFWTSRRTVASSYGQPRTSRETTIELTPADRSHACGQAGGRAVAGTSAVQGLFTTFVEPSPGSIYRGPGGRLPDRAAGRRAVGRRAVGRMNPCLLQLSWKGRRNISQRYHGHMAIGMMEIREMGWDTC